MPDRKCGTCHYCRHTIPGRGMCDWLNYHLHASKADDNPIDATDCWWSSATMPQWASRSRLLVREVGVEGGRWKHQMEKMG